MIKYGEAQSINTPDLIFWASVYKAICSIKGAPAELVSRAENWLFEHGMSPRITLGGSYANLH